jgi:carboxymethylenebutenolidase
MTIKTQWLQIPVGTQSFKAYLAAPDLPQPRPGVLVVQEIFGVNSHIRSVAERVAEAGYVALAPDLFWRVQPGFEVGYTPDDIAKGREVRGKLDTEQVMADIKAAAAVLAGRPETNGRKQAVMGFCWGGQIAYLAACRMKPDAAAVYYGGGIANLLKESSGIAKPVMFHFGELDKGIPLSEVEQIQKAMQSHKDATVFVYPGADHGFHCDQRGSYHAPSAAKAWQRTLEFFGKNLG